MTAASTYAALLPALRAEWHATNTLAGTVSGAFFAGYMLAVPALASMTDRVPPRRVYLAACAALAAGAVAFAFATGPLTAVLAQALLGAGLAGTYMPGLKELSDRVTGPYQSRAVAFYTSTFGLGNSLSLWMAGTMHAAAGWRMAFVAAAAGPLAAAALVALALPPRPFTPASVARVQLFGDVLRAPRIRRYVLSYAAHCCELFAVRSWIVALLTHAGAGARMPASTIAAAVNLIGPPASIGGNEFAAGRRMRTVRGIMVTSAILALVTGAVANQGTLIVVAVFSVYMVAVMADSAAMTAGLVEVSPPEARGTAMAVYSFFGFGGALAGPIVFGALLDAAGAETARHAWLRRLPGLPPSVSRALRSFATVTRLEISRDTV